MNDNVIPFTGLTYMDVPVDKVLDGAKEMDAKAVVVVCLTEEGEIYTFHSSSSVPEINWMLDIAKQDILIGDYE